MKKILFIISLVILAGHLRAQDNNLSFQFSEILFRDLVDTIEKRAEVKIYYTNKWIDSLYLNINAKNDSIESLLRKSLKKEGFSFIITENNKVIISKGYTIKTNFKEQYNAYLKKSMVSLILHIISDLFRYRRVLHQAMNIRYLKLEDHLIAGRVTRLPFQGLLLIR